MNSIKSSEPGAPPGALVTLYAWKIFVDRAIVFGNDSQALVWNGGACGIARCWPIIRGHHSFIYEPYGEEGAGGETKQCKFVQVEVFSGLLSIFTFIYGPIMKAGFKKMNKDLKKRVESLAAAGEDTS